MARVNITIPDELLVRARAAGLSVSACASQGLAAELDRLESRDEIVRYLAELDEELGPVPAEQAAAAAAWADHAFGPTTAAPARSRHPTAAEPPPTTTSAAAENPAQTAAERRSATSKKAGARVG